MSQQHVDLCTLLVEENCGCLASKIFAAVAQYGGLPSYTISQVTGIGLQRLKPILSIMIKQRILLHRTNVMDLSIYQADIDSAYEHLRSHRLISLAQDRHGEAAAKLVSHIHLLGQAGVGELVDALCLDKKHEPDGKTGCNGNSEAARDADDDGDNAAEDGDSTNPIFTTTAEVHSLLRSLLRDGFLTKVGKRSFTPAVDLKYEMEDMVRESMPDNKVTAKRQGEFEEGVKNLKRRWLEEDEYNDFRDGGSARPSKRAKLNGSDTKGLGHDAAGQTADSGVVLPMDMTVRVSFARCTQDLSENYLKRLADRYLGDTTAAVYGALLQAIHSSKSIQHRSTLADAGYALSLEQCPTVSTIEVSQHLDSTLDLAFPISGVSHSYKLNGNGEATKRQKLSNGDDFTDIGIKNEHESEDEDQPNEVSAYQQRNKLLSLIEEHLRLLEEHPKGFCKRVVSGGRGEWGVDFAILGDTIEKMETDNIILSRFGKTQMRLVRMLRDKGKLDEKQVAALSIMRIKDVRAVMTELKYAGYVDAPEVPKDASRQAGRSIFLWGHQQEGVRDLILQHCYESIARILQRLKKERHDYRAISEKAELMHDRQDALSKNDRDMIMKAREIEEKLLAQVQRIDELVAIMGRSHQGQYNIWQ